MSYGFGNSASRSFQTRLKCCCSALVFWFVISWSVHDFMLLLSLKKKPWWRSWFQDVSSFLAIGKCFVVKCGCVRACPKSQFPLYSSLSFFKMLRYESGRAAPNFNVSRCGWTLLVTKRRPRRRLSTAWAALVFSFPPQSRDNLSCQTWPPDQADVPNMEWKRAIQWLQQEQNSDHAVREYARCEHDSNFVLGQKKGIQIKRAI